MVFTSGQLGIKPDGVTPEGAKEQTRVALQNVKQVLEAAGAGVEHIVRLNAFVTGREHLPGYMAARDEMFGELPPAASTLMIVSGFARPEFVVEVEAIAALPAAADGGARTAAASTSGASVQGAASGRRGMHSRAAAAAAAVRTHRRGSTASVSPRRPSTTLSPT